MQDICDGCLTNTTTMCTVKNRIENCHCENDCPCIKCLIKSMCTDPCSIYMTYGRFLKEREASL